MEKKLKIALFHPWLKSRGGAERVVLEFLKNTSFEVDLYTWVYKEENTFEEFKKFKINVIAPKFLERFSNKFILRSVFSLFGLFSKIPLKNYDFFFISTSGIAEFITLRNYKPGKTFAYVHTILRDSYKDNVRWNLKYRYNNYFSKLFYLAAVFTYRFFERIFWRRIDVPIFNSRLSLNRAKSNNLLGGKEPFIVYPPVPLKKLGKSSGKIGNYFLYVSRFNLAKRQDVLIKSWKAFVKTNKGYKLVLVGGSENKDYFDLINKSINKEDNIEIKMDVSDEELRKLYSECLAVVFVPLLEDFGIVPFEALSFGRPLIAVDKGGYMDLIKNSPNLIKIRELLDSNLMVEEISEKLNFFVGRKGNYNYRPEKFPKLSPNNFTREIERIFKKA